jgi:hypothetical protein
LKIISTFCTQASDRKSRLDDSYYLHRFLADFRDLVSWIADMKAIISADELAKDVAGAEALLERHQEHKVIFVIITVVIVIVIVMFPGIDNPVCQK